MTTKKYELTTTTKVFNGVTLYQIKALKDFGNIKNGELGGWIEKENNLSQEDSCWVSGNAQVYGDACVYGNANVSGNACVSSNSCVYGNAKVSGDACVYGDAKVSGNACVSGNAWVSGNAQVSDAQVSGNAWVSGNAGVSGNAQVSGNAGVYGNAQVSGSARVYGNAQVYGNAHVSGNAWVSGNACLSSKMNYTSGRFIGGDDTKKITTLTKEQVGNSYWNVQYVLGNVIITPQEEEKPTLSGKTVTVEVDGVKYEAIIK